MQNRAARQIVATFLVRKGRRTRKVQHSAPFNVRSTVDHQRVVLCAQAKEKFEKLGHIRLRSWHLAA